LDAPLQLLLVILKAEQENAASSENLLIAERASERKRYVLK
jgi:hypothetical protein